MVRKSIVSLLLVLLLTLGCTCAFAVSAVVDGAGLFTADEIGRMEKVIEQIRSKYKVDAYVLTTYDFPSGLTDKQIQDRVDVWYEQNGCGIGSDRAGVVYAIDMSNRASVISTAGVMIDYLDDDRYFAIHRPDQNLDRCRTQLRLVADMEKKSERMLEIVRDAWKTNNK